MNHVCRKRCTNADANLVLCACHPSGLPLGPQKGSQQLWLIGSTNFVSTGNLKPKVIISRFEVHQVQKLYISRFGFEDHYVQKLYISRFAKH